MNEKTVFVKEVVVFGKGSGVLLRKEWRLWEGVSVQKVTFFMKELTSFVKEVTRFYKINGVFYGRLINVL